MLYNGYGKNGHHWQGANNATKIWQEWISLHHFIFIQNAFRHVFWFWKKKELFSNCDGNQKSLSPTHDVNIYSLCIWIWPVQFKLHIIQAHRLPLTFFELLEPNLVVLIKLQFGFLLCSDLWLSFWRSNSYRNEVKTNEKSTIPHFTIK